MHDGIGFGVGLVEILSIDLGIAHRGVLASIASTGPSRDVVSTVTVADKPTRSGDLTRSASSI